MTVTCTEGPEASTSEERTIQLEAGVAAGGKRSGRWVGVAVAILVAALGTLGMTQAAARKAVERALRDMGNDAALEAVVRSALAGA